MNPIVENKPGAYLVGGEQAGQPEYNSLEVVRGEHGALWSAWRPSLKEFLLIALGHPVRIGILSERQPPIVVEVSKSPVNGKPGIMLATGGYD